LSASQKMVVCALWVAVGSVGQGQASVPTMSWWLDKSLHHHAARLRSDHWGGALTHTRSIFFGQLFSVNSVVRRIAIAACAQKSFSLFVFSCGESPRRYRACPRLFYGKRPPLSATVLVEDGGNDLHGMGVVSFRAPSHPLCDFPRRVSFDKGAGVRRYEHVRCSLVASMRSPSLLIETVMRLSTPSWSFQLNGAHSRSSLLFFPYLEPRRSKAFLVHVFVNGELFVPLSLGILMPPFCMMCWLFLNFFMVYTPMYHSVIGGVLQILTPLIFPFLSVSCP
jgi:hypothetical protein